MDQSKVQTGGGVQNPEDYRISFVDCPLEAIFPVISSPAGEVIHLIHNAWIFRIKCTRGFKNKLRSKIIFMPFIDLCRAIMCTMYVHIRLKIYPIRPTK